MADNYGLPLTSDSYSPEDAYASVSYVNQQAEQASNSPVSTQRIEDAAITTAKIADAQITSAKIANANIMTAHIGDAQITSAKIQNAAITTILVADAAITNAKIDRATVDKLVVVTADIADAAISTAKIGDAQIITAKIADAQITNAKIQDATIDGAAKIKLASITTSLIQDASITSALIQDLAVTNAKINDVSAGKLTAGTIDTGLVTISGTGGKLILKNNRIQVFDKQTVPVERVAMGDVMGDGSVYGFLMRGADGTTVLMDINGVKSAGITDGAITNPKIGDGAVKNVNIFAGTITGDRLVAETITSREIKVGTITAASGIIANATIGTAQIIDGAITTVKIGDAQITSAKIVDLDAAKLKANTIIAGNITFTGKLQGATGSFSGDISATSFTLNSKIGSKITIKTGYWGSGGATWTDTGDITVGNADTNSERQLLFEMGDLGRVVLNGNFGSGYNYYEMPLEIRAQNGSLSGIGFHRAGYTAVSLVHDSDNRLKIYRADAVNGYGDLTLNNLNANNAYVSSIYASNWLRTTGNSGWYSETYGGGWYMTDTSWIRSFNNKHLYLGPGLGAQFDYWIGGTNLDVLLLGNWGTGRIDLQGGVARYQKDSSNYVFAQAGITGAYTSGVLSHMWKIGDSAGHRFLQAAGSGFQFLSGGGVQARRYDNGAYDQMYATGFTPSSRREWKKNIVPFTSKATNIINDTTVYSYNLKEELDSEMKHVGVIMDESPVEIVDIRGQGVELYPMVSLAWKAIQELSDRITQLETKLIA